MNELNIKWKNQDAADYKLNADNLHQIHPDKNTLFAPFLVAGTTSHKHLIVKENTAIKIINAGTHKVFQAGAADVEIDAVANLDTGTSFSAGTDYYVYVCDEADGTASIVVSLNSTYPDGYTADNSRKIGGFHTLCANVGTISGHDLSDYSAGDILPASIWCLNHRPKSDPEGMVYDAGSGIWVDIYLASVQSGELGSVYNATTADGSSAEAFHWYKFDQWFHRIKKRMPFQGEFQSLSMGSNQGTNIAGSADPGSTGGHSDTAGRRMISNIGVEDACGAFWQWGIEGGATNDVGSAWADAYDANDSGVGGQHYEAPNRPRFGGGWGDGVICGSRGSYWSSSPVDLGANHGARGVSEPRSA